MRAPGREIDWFDRLVAVWYSIVLVLGLAIVTMTFVIYFPVTGDVAVPMP